MSCTSLYSASSGLRYNNRNINLKYLLFVCVCVETPMLWNLSGALSIYSCRVQADLLLPNRSMFYWWPLQAGTVDTIYFEVGSKTIRWKSTTENTYNMMHPSKGPSEPLKPRRFLETFFDVFEGQIQETARSLSYLHFSVLFPHGHHRVNAGHVMAGNKPLK